MRINFDLRLPEVERALAEIQSALSNLISKVDKMPTNQEFFDLMKVAVAEEAAQVKARLDELEALIAASAGGAIPQALADEMLAGVRGIFTPAQAPAPTPAPEPTPGLPSDF